MNSIGEQEGTARRVEGGPTSPPGRTSPSRVEDAPDPDEGDLDDLDDMLDEFSIKQTTAQEEKTASVEATKGGQPEVSDMPDATAEDFNKQLQDQMAALMGNMDESPEIRREIEAMMKELGTAADSPTQPDASISGEENASATFQDTIRKTMERMEASEGQASAAAGSDDSDDILAQMLKNMRDGPEDAPADEEGFNKMLLGMMEQLTNKEILHEPMKELNDKFPAWMRDNSGKTSAEDLQRYQEQQKLVKQIVERFESKDYSDQRPADREFIVDRMQQMQAAGSPPADLVGDMNAATDALNDIDTGCPQQ